VFAATKKGLQWLVGYRITGNILAMARPNSQVIDQCDIIKSFIQ